MKDVKKLFWSENILYLIWFQAVVATLGSLFLSMVMRFPPCSLCWYQRVLMYPIPIILTVGILRKRAVDMPFYVLPFSILGSLIALYHLLLQENLIPSSLVPCGIEGISCGTKYVNFLGFITIPLMSLTAFLIITALMIIYAKYKKIIK